MLKFENIDFFTSVVMFVLNLNRVTLNRSTVSAMDLRELRTLRQFFVKVGNAVTFHTNNLSNSVCRLSYCQSIFLFCACMCNIWILSLNKHDVRAWIKSIWLRIGTSGGFLQTRSVIWGLLKSQKNLHQLNDHYFKNMAGSCMYCFFVCLLDNQTRKINWSY